MHKTVLIFSQDYKYQMKFRISFISFCSYPTKDRPIVAFKCHFKKFFSLWLLYQLDIKLIFCFFVFQSSSFYFSFLFFFEHVKHSLHNSEVYSKKGRPFFLLALKGRCQSSGLDRTNLFPGILTFLAKELMSHSFIEIALTLHTFHQALLRRSSLKLGYI